MKLSRMERWADRRVEIKKESERIKAIVEHHDAMIESIDDLKTLWEEEK